MASLSLYLVPSDHLSWTSVENEVVIVNLSTGDHCVLNPTGSIIWKMSDGKKQLAEVVRKIVQEYDIDETTAIKDVKHFTRKLVSAGLAKLRRRKG